MKASDYCSPGTCIRIVGRHLDDVLMVDSPMPGQPPHHANGLLLTTGERVTLIFVKNASGTVHMKRAGGVHHLEALGLMTKDEVAKYRRDNRLRLQGKIRQYQIYLAQFDTNCKNFARAMRVFQQ